MKLRLSVFVILILLLVDEFHPEHPFKINTIRKYEIKLHTRIAETIKKALGLQSHTINELTVLVSSDKIDSQGEKK